MNVNQKKVFKINCDEQNVGKKNVKIKNFNDHESFFRILA